MYQFDWPLHEKVHYWFYCDATKSARGVNWSSNETATLLYLVT
jgi:hypothetical protein